MLATHLIANPRMTATTMVSNHDCVGYLHDKAITTKNIVQNYANQREQANQQLQVRNQVVTAESHAY
jgi:hypothetical protein